MTSAPVPLAEQIAVINRVMMRPQGMPSPHRDFYEEARDEREATVLIAAIATLQQHERAISDLAAANERIRELTRECGDLQRTFDLQWAADQRAIKRWQEAHPGNDLVWPDRANMVVWLMDQLDAAITKHERAMAVVKAAKRFRDDATGSLATENALWDALDELHAANKVGDTK